MRYSPLFLPILTGFFLSVFLGLAFSAQAQNAPDARSQTVRGTVLDIQSETPLIGASVELVGSNPILGTVTDENGFFVLRQVPLGRQVLRVRYLGYSEITVPNVLVTAGKETILDLRLEESLETLNEVVISADSDKERPVNELATISARQFNTEEVRRYSGGRNDVAKLVSNFAGVAASNDSRNDIIIRGNSPTGVLWRMEGLPMPSPNHFSTIGTTGGPVSALNPNLIANSDFLTGAFPAEYGNALAGVFDINLRRGNPDRLEFTGQIAAFSGLEAMIEGPLRNKNGGTFVASYRHSFVELAHAAGMQIGTNAVPRYKDLSFNVDFGKGKLGNLSVYGIAAHSNIDFIGAELDSTDLWASPGTDAYNVSWFGVLGAKHTYMLNDHSYVRTALSGSFTKVTYEQYDLENPENTPISEVSVFDQLPTLRFSTFYNNKINARLNLRTGVLVQQQQYDTRVRTRENTPDFDGDGLSDWWTLRDNDDWFTLGEAYAQAKYRLSTRFTVNAGLHAQYFSFTNDAALEPRLALNYDLNPKSQLNLGYGLHHQTQPLPIFLFRKQLPDGGSAPANDDLGFTRNQHLVLGYNYKPAKDWRVKAETYYQWLSNVPVDAYASSFSMLNTGADFIFPEKGDLVNDGTGTNLGAELTVEKFFSQHYYGLLSVSAFESTYKGSDGVERSTAFDGGFVLNALAGREFPFGKNRQNAITFDTRVAYAKGRPFTPINLEESRRVGREVLYDNQAFSARLDDYFRWDVKFGYRLNSSKRRLSQTFFLDFQNVTNHSNIFAQRYNTNIGAVGRINQIGFFPDVLYRIEF